MPAAHLLRRRLALANSVAKLFFALGLIRPISGLVLIPYTCIRSRVIAGFNEVVMFRVLLVLFFSATVQAQCPRDYRSIDRGVVSEKVWLEQVFNEAGCRIVYVERPKHYTDWLWELKQGRIEVLSAITPLPERLEYGQFSIAYAQESVVVVASSSIAKTVHVKKIIDLLTLNLTVLGPSSGYYGQEWEPVKNELQRKGSLKTYGNWSEAGGLLQEKGNHVAILVDDAARHIVSRSRQKLEILPTALYQSDVVLMFSRKTVTAAEVEQFNAAIKRLLQRGVKPG